jgi:hypothetical protein
MSSKPAKTTSIKKTPVRTGIKKKAFFAPVVKAWQPFTFGGVVRFSYAGSLRLLMMQLVFAALSLISVVFFLDLQWTPVIDRAMTRLPYHSEIRGGRLQWSGPSLEILAESPFLALVVAMDDNQRTGQISDLQLELAPRELRIRSIGGRMDVPYPSDWIFSLGKNEAVPCWEAWRPMILAGCGLGMAALLIVAWALLATLYAPLVRIWAFVLRRNTTLGGCWRLSGAALMPGAVFFLLCTLLYSLRQLDLIIFIGAFIVHLAIPWVYLLVAPLKMPAR